MSVETLNYFLALGTVVMQVVTLGLIAAMFLRKKYKDFGDILAPFSKWGVEVGLALALAGIFFTLLYSEVLGFEPCFLCWWQRVFLYPQAVIFGIALLHKQSRASASLYSIWLSVIGAIFAAYHHAMQIFPEGSLPCSANGPSCAKITFIEFGYVTYPMMALSLFALLIVMMIILRKEK